MVLSEQQMWAISATERVCSTISLIGTFVIVSTFIWSTSFRKPINRLVFYASWGNIMANVAAIIAQDGIHIGIDSALCQFQGFLIQWFMPADALWTFAMACNVYLTFFHKYNSEQLRQLEWKYVLFCYGTPFVPAFAYFFVTTQARGRIYGSAILWCWIAIPWDFLRIAIFYGPVWFVISLTFAIYLRAGSVIYQKRRQLRNLGGIDSLDPYFVPSVSPFATLAGIQVTREIACYSPEQRYPSTSGPHGLPSPSFKPYSVTIQGGSSGDVPLSSEHNSRLTSFPPQKDGQFKAGRVDMDSASQRRSLATEANSAAWAYTKYAMLFFIALLVTWVPSTINRAYSLAHPDRVSFGLKFVGAFVLPLQGFWNSLIYVSISWPAFKLLWQDIRAQAALCHISCFKAKLEPSHTRRGSVSLKIPVALEEGRIDP
ncbi:uncharacterized protein N7511_000923 [Penicillium nucicola]|uniref:uncharacterized protein n=1 Tax=Penicillium nucicola TaxID=1850975 RepID=UPI002544DD63|nr:uncharacterized protein N7511_000923 [Penicillium nucicola]KAJ5775912.1 hypothetical protein N7511_000923 [Penicillium nucicola]